MLTAKAWPRLPTQSEDDRLRQEALTIESGDEELLGLRINERVDAFYVGPHALESAMDAFRGHGVEPQNTIQGRFVKIAMFQNAWCYSAEWDFPDEDKLVLLPIAVRWARTLLGVAVVAQARGGCALPSHKRRATSAFDEGDARDEPPAYSKKLWDTNIAARVDTAVLRHVLGGIVDMRVPTLCRLLGESASLSFFFAFFSNAVVQFLEQTTKALRAGLMLSARAERRCDYDPLANAFPTRLRVARVVSVPSAIFDALFHEATQH